MENKTNTVIEGMLEVYRDVPVIMEEYNDTPISDEKFEGLKGIWNGEGKVKKQKQPKEPIKMIKVRVCGEIGETTSIIPFRNGTYPVWFKGIDTPYFCNADQVEFIKDEENN